MKSRSLSMLKKLHWVSPPVVNLARLLLQESENTAEKMLDTLVGMASHHHCLHTTNSIMYDIKQELCETVLTIQGCCSTGVEDPQPQIFCAELHQLVLFASHVRASAAPSRWWSTLLCSGAPEGFTSSSSEWGFSHEYRVLFHAYVCSVKESTRFISAQGFSADTYIYIYIYIHT